MVVVVTDRLLTRFLPLAEYKHIKRVKHYDDNVKSCRVIMPGEVLNDKCVLVALCPHDDTMVMPNEVTDFIKNNV